MNSRKIADSRESTSLLMDSREIMNHNLNSRENEDIHEDSRKTCVNRRLGFIELSLWL